MTLTRFRRFSPRGPALPVLAAALSLAALLFALHIQSQGKAPCPLCILQRIGFLAVLVFAVLAALAVRAAAWRTLWLLLALAGALGGLGVALRHVWLTLHPGQTCGLDPLAVQINHWPVTQWAPWFFRADGFCADVPRELGLPLPAWAAIGFVVAAGLLLAALLRRR